MHAYSARSSGAKSHSWNSSHRQQLSLSLFSIMSTDDEVVAKALNSCRNEGLEMLGGADRLALEELLSELVARPGSAPPPDDCKLYPLMNNVMFCSTHS